MTYKMQSKRTRRNGRKAFFTSVCVHLAILGGIIYSTGGWDDLQTMVKGVQTETVTTSEMKAPQDKALTSKKSKSSRKKP